MSEEPQVPAPEIGITEPQTQPQVAPVTPPEGGQVGGQPEGTTDANAQREQFYQTKYQDTIAELNKYRDFYGPIDGGTQQPHQPQPTPPPQQQYEEPEDLDNEAAWMDQVAQKSSDYTFKKLQSWMTEQQKRQALEQRYQAEMNFAGQHLNTWATTNKVPQDVLQQHINQVTSELPPGTRPTVAAKYVMQSIITQARASAQNEQLAQLQAQAAQRGKELSGVIQPAPGQSPNPQPQVNKTLGQSYADRILPDDPEPIFD